MSCATRISTFNLKFLQWDTAHHNDMCLKETQRGKDQAQTKHLRIFGHQSIRVQELYMKTGYIHDTNTIAIPQLYGVGRVLSDTNIHCGNMLMYLGLCAALMECETILSL